MPKVKIIKLLTFNCKGKCYLRVYWDNKSINSYFLDISDHVSLMSEINDFLLKYNKYKIKP